jgi:hypothetical protein
VSLLLDVFSDLLGLLIVLFCGSLIIVFVALGRSKPGRNLRDIPAYTRFRREVGLAVEAGKRLHISLGRGAFTGLQSGSAYAGLTMLERCARAASISDCPPVATSADPVLMFLSQDTMRSTYRAMGAEGRYDATNGRLVGLTPLAYAAGAMPLIRDEQVSANILAGHFGGEIALLTDAAERSGGLTVAGSDSLPGQAVLFASAEEPLIGEELYAGGAYLGAGPMHTASLRMQDALRWILIAIILLGAIAKLLIGGLS